MSAPNISTEATTALSTTYVILTIDGAAAEGVALPDRCYLEYMHAQLDTISGATAIVWYLCSDAAGDVPLTKEVTSAIVVGATTATDGAVVEALGVAYRRFAAGTSGAIYVAAKTDAGTCNAVTRVVWTL